MADPAPSSRILEIPNQLLAALRNAIDIARVGRLEQTARAPHDIALRDARFRLRHYEGAEAGPPILLIPPLMLTAEVYDVTAAGSVVRALAQAGVDPWVVDFGAPEKQEGALERTLDDHILAIDRAVQHIRDTTGRDVHLAGYSQGGIFAYLVAAFRRSNGLASVITFGSPVNVHEDVLPGIPDDIALALLETLGKVMSAGFASTAVPAWLSRTAFKLMSPTKEIRNQIEFLRSLGDRESIVRREGQRRFLADEGWVAWPGPAFSQFIEQMIMGNRLFSGGFVVEGRTVTLADITVPVLAFVGENDDIARPHTVRSVGEAAPHAELWEAPIRAGHMGLVIGSTALAQTWPTVCEWIEWREGRGEQPVRVVPLGTSDLEGAENESRERLDEDEQSGALGLAGALGRDLATSLLDVFGDSASSLRSMGTNVIGQLPRLLRLGGLRRTTRVGIALTLDEQADETPNATFFLYEGRAHTYAAANRRVDAIVRGLVSIGVRAGEHVGVLMHSRPSALAVITAINRLGAVAVLLRDNEDVAAELKVGQVEHLIVDPDHAEVGRDCFPGQVYALGGVGRSDRSIADGVIDLENVDPARVALPEWYTSSPGTAEDVAFIFFAGRGATLRGNRVSNRRWALSALGAASATAMTSTDTVYSWAPVHHPTGLLVSVSGALAAGARLAMAQGFDAETFWEEVRRYGTSVVFYTGTMLRELVDAPRVEAERNHPLRMFAGSGMPAPLWQRAVERFGPINVLEFWASTEGSAIMANISGRKIGSVGRVMPGSSAVRIAEWDLERRRPVLDGSGYVREVSLGGTGMLLTQVDTERGSVTGKPLRSAFARGDAWRVSGSLFRQDDDGDYWLMDNAADVILTDAGPVPSIPIEEAVWELPEVSAAAAFGAKQDGNIVPAVAVLLREGATLGEDAVRAIVEERVGAHSVPEVVRFVDELPMTAGYRVLKANLA